MSTSQSTEADDLAHAEISRCLFAASADAILIVDPGTGQMLEVNDATVRITESAREQLLGRNLATVLSTEGLMSVDQLLATALSPGSFHSAEPCSIQTKGSFNPRVDVDVHAIHAKNRTLALVVARRPCEEQLGRSASCADAEQCQVEQLLRIENAMLERIAVSGSSQEILDQLCEQAESFVYGATSAFWRLDDVQN